MKIISILIGAFSALSLVSAQDDDHSELKTLPADCQIELSKKNNSTFTTKKIDFFKQYSGTKVVFTDCISEEKYEVVIESKGSTYIVSIKEGNTLVTCSVDPQTYNNTLKDLNYTNNSSLVCSGREELSVFLACDLSDSCPEPEKFCDYNMVYGLSCEKLGTRRKPDEI